MITIKQKIMLFLISCDPGIKDQYKMIKVYDRVDFPWKLSENLKPLLDNNFIYVSKYLDNGTAFAYETTEKGIEYLNHNFNSEEMIEHIKSMQSPDLLLQLVQAYIQKKNGI
jgi:hypothetical protein